MTPDRLTIQASRQPMRVLFLATRDWRHPAAAGGDIQMWEFARYLASREHDVTFVACGFPGAAREEVIDRVRVVRLGSASTLWVETFLYYRRHGKGRCDVVVAEGFGGSRIPRFAPLYVREPIVTEWHQIHRALFANQYPRVVRPLLNALERVAAHIHRHTFVRAGTVEWQAAFPRIGFKPERIFVVPVSVREEWLDTPPTRVSAPTVVWVGKFRRYKCPHHAVLAMRDVVAQIPQARLVLVGRHDDRKYEAWLERLAAKLGIGRQVDFHFGVSEERKRSILRRCRVLALPSSVEGFGIVVLEANACGIPVVASTGIPESVVRHEFNGLRYPFGEVGALAGSLLRLLREDDLHARLSENAFHFARRFRWADVGARFERTLLGIVNRHAAGTDAGVIPGEVTL